MNDQWNHKIFSVSNARYEPLALDVFRFQYDNNPVYKAYIQALRVNPRGINSIFQIPFLPISFFKTHTVATSQFEPMVVFESSGTTQATNSRHFIIGLYGKQNDKVKQSSGKRFLPG
jgi:hypothetical protein